MPKSFCASKILKEGLERGTEQSKNEIAKNVLKKGLDISLISGVNKSDSSLLNGGDTITGL